MSLLLLNIQYQTLGVQMGDFSPWALKVYKGEVYIGVTCTAETSGLISDLNAYVMKLSGSGFITEFDFPLDYDRGCIFGNSSKCDEAEWQPWIVDWPGVSLDPSFDIVRAPQPLLSDIEFDIDGSLILSIMDRSAHQLGYRQYETNTGNTTDLWDHQNAGDLKRACWNGSGYDFEGTGSCPTNFLSLYDENTTFEGDGTAAEYYDTKYIESGRGHEEIHLGAIALLPGSGDVVGVTADPNAFFTGGLEWHNNQTGSTAGGVTLYGNAAGEFSKGGGLGDIELLCSSAPLEIGNYVWCDSLENGIQDACERGIDDIIVQLYDRNGLLVGQDTTVNGQYYFNENNVDTVGITVNGSGIASPSPTGFTGMSYATQYFIVFGGGQFATDEFTVGGETYGITSMVNAGSNDNIDSDVDGGSLTTGSLGARPDGLPFIDMTTSAIGCGDHKYDLGLTCVVYDWGDLPDTSSMTNTSDYQTLAANNGPRHQIISGLSLGSMIDDESDGQPSENALDDGADEDGLTLFATLDLSPGSTFRLPFSYINTTGNTAHVEAWIDWNGDGAFDGAGEMVVDWNDGAGALPNNIELTIPQTAQTGIFLGYRIRISNQDNMTPYGMQPNGEIEDYLISIDCPHQICIPIQTTVIRKE